MCTHMNNMAVWMKIEKQKKIMFIMLTDIHFMINLSHICSIIPFICRKSYWWLFFLFFMYTVKSIVLSSNTAHYCPCRYNGLCSCNTTEELLHTDVKSYPWPYSIFLKNYQNFESNYISIENNTFHNPEKKTLQYQISLLMKKTGENRAACV